MAQPLYRVALLESPWRSDYLNVRGMSGMTQPLMVRTLLLPQEAQRLKLQREIDELNALEKN
jgi:hypothetical protein